MASRPNNHHGPALLEFEVGRVDRGDTIGTPPDEFSATVVVTGS
jgi:hypothetical protein